MHRATRRSTVASRRRTQKSDVVVKSDPLRTPIADVVNQIKSAGLGYERVEHLQGSTYKESSTVVIIPTRGMVPDPVITKWLGLIAPMNQKRAILFASG